MAFMKEYHSYEDYELASNSLRAVCGMVLFSFAEYECSNKDLIIRNFIAKSSMSLKGIFSLWEIESYYDCWILYRALLDRYLHLSHIGENNEFEQFDDWSFFKQMVSHNHVRSDARFKSELDNPVYNISKEQKERLRALSKNKPKWKRPKAEQVAKDLDMDFIYKFGYDMASMHVHPMANDGQQDFYTITKLKSDIDFPSRITVLNNSILVVTMLLQDSMYLTNFRWRPVVLDFINDIRKFLSQGDLTYRHTFKKIAELFPENLGKAS